MFFIINTCGFVSNFNKTIIQHLNHQKAADSNFLQTHAGYVRKTNHANVPDNPVLDHSAVCCLGKKTRIKRTLGLIKAHPSLTLLPGPPLLQDTVILWPSSCFSDYTSDTPDVSLMLIVEATGHHGNV